MFHTIFDKNFLGMILNAQAANSENKLDYIKIFRASLVAQTVKRLPTMRETQVRSLGREDPLEKEMAIHSSTLGLDNPMDGGVWQAIVHGVTKSRTGLSDFTFTFTSKFKTSVHQRTQSTE